MKRLIVACVIVLFFSSWALSEEQFEAHFIDVGQGDCILLLCPDGRKILVDCGSSGGGDVDRVKDYVCAHLGADHPSLDALVITHTDSDHHNWIPYVLDGVKAKTVITSRPVQEFKSGCSQNGVKYKCSEWLAKQSGVKDLEPDDYDKEGQPSKLFGAGNTKFYVVAADTGQSKNDRSVVLLVSYKDFDLLLMGDASKRVEKKIMERYSKEWLDCEVLKVGHHGSESSSSAKWLEVAKPEVSILSCGYVNDYGHPRKTAVKRLEDFAVEENVHEMRWGIDEDEFENVPNYKKAVYSTATNGTVVVKSNGKTFSVEYQTRIEHKFENN